MAELTGTSGLLPLNRPGISRATKPAVLDSGQCPNWLKRKYLTRCCNNIEIFL